LKVNLNALARKRAREVSTFAIALLMIGLVIGVGLSTPICYAPEPPYNETDAKEFDPDDLPWDNETDVIIIPSPSNETDVIIIPSPSLPPIFSDFNITPTEIQLGDDLIISFVIENRNNHSYTWMSTTRIGDFFTQIIEIELDAYESKVIWYRIIPHVVGEYDVWIVGQTGTFMVMPTDPLPITNETDPEIIVTDALEELNLKIDHLNTDLQDLTREFFSLQTDYNADVEELNSKIDTMETTLETYYNEVHEEIEQLENKISNLQTNILYACIATAIIAVLGAFLLIKKMN